MEYALWNIVAGDCVVVAVDKKDAVAALLLAPFGDFAFDKDAEDCDCDCDLLVEEAAKGSALGFFCANGGGGGALPSIPWLLLRSSEFS